MPIINLRTSGFNSKLRAGEPERPGAWRPRSGAATKDAYSRALQKHRAEPLFDAFPASFPRGELAGLEGTGVAFIDDSVGGLVKDVHDLSIAVKICMGFAVAAGVASTILLISAHRADRP